MLGDNRAAKELWGAARIRWTRSISQGPMAMPSARAISAVFLAELPQREERWTGYVLRVDGGGMVEYHQPWERAPGRRRALKLTGGAVLVGLVAAVVVVGARYACRQGLGTALRVPASLEKYVWPRGEGARRRRHTPPYPAENEFQRNVESMFRKMPVLGPHVRSVKWSNDFSVMVYVDDYPVNE